jgi:hypothetical protein
VPTPLPPLGAPVRVAFAGAAGTFAPHAQHVRAGGIDPSFLHVGPGATAATVRAQLESFAPHVLVAFAPAAALTEVAQGMDAVTLAVHAPPDAPFDRVLAAPGGDGWRARPLPVDDRLYLPTRASRHPPRTLAIGRSTPHREAVLTPAKHSQDIVHYAHGLEGESLREQLLAADVGVATLPEPGGAGFPPQALLHLAAGQLLIAEPFSPACGLEPGIDFLEAATPDLLVTLLAQLALRPDAYERVRIRGRLKAEEHRASRVWPRLVGDLLADVRAF